MTEKFLELCEQYSRAIQRGIGERFAQLLADEISPIPTNMEWLLIALTDLESDAPPIVPPQSGN
jgi:hypothetical protein